jgi:hypothetical protein
MLLFVKEYVLSTQRMANVVHPRYALVLPVVRPRSNYPQQAPQAPNQLERQSEVHKIHPKAIFLYSETMRI